MSLQPASPSTLSSIRAEHPGLPEGYLSFLADSGWGVLSSGVMLYEGPVSTDFIYGPRSVDLPEVVPIGDDFAGTVFAFVPSEGWIVVAIDSLDLGRYPEGSWGEFLGRYHEPSGIR